MPSTAAGLALKTDTDRNHRPGRSDPFSLLTVCSLAGAAAAAADDDDDDVEVNVSAHHSSHTLHQKLTIDHERTHGLLSNHLTCVSSFIWFTCS